MPQKKKRKVRLNKGKINPKIVLGMVAIMVALPIAIGAALQQAYLKNYAFIDTAASEAVPNFNSAEEVTYTLNSDGTMGPSSHLENYAAAQPAETKGTLELKLASYDYADPTPTVSYPNPTTYVYYPPENEKEKKNNKGKGKGKGYGKSKRNNGPQTITSLKLTITKAEVHYAYKEANIYEGDYTDPYTNTTTNYTTNSTYNDTTNSTYGTTNNTYNYTTNSTYNSTTNYTYNAPSNSYNDKPGNGKGKAKGLEKKNEKDKKNNNNGKKNQNYVAADQPKNKWETLNIPNPTYIDLLDESYGNPLTTLGVTELYAGKYTEIRLYVSEAKATLKNGTTVNVNVLGKNKVVRIVKPFTIVEGKATILTLDVDKEHSVIKTGNTYFLKPVIAKIVQGY